MDLGFAVQAIWHRAQLQHFPGRKVSRLGLCCVFSLAQGSAAAALPAQGSVLCTIVFQSTRLHATSLAVSNINRAVSVQQLSQVVNNIQLVADKFSVILYYLASLEIEIKLCCLNTICFSPCKGISLLLPPDSLSTLSIFTPSPAPCCEPVPAFWVKPTAQLQKCPSY